MSGAKSTAGAKGARLLIVDDDADLRRLQPLNLYGKSKHDFDLWVADQVTAGARQPRQSVSNC